ncbi:tetratricopeptide repeat protein [Verrucomicrobiota bacterium]
MKALISYFVFRIAYLVFNISSGSSRNTLSRPTPGIGPGGYKITLQCKFVSLIASLLLASPVLAEIKDHDESLQFANGLYVRGIHDLAIKEYKSFLHNFPDSKKSDVVCFRLGESYEQMGESLKAAGQYLHVFTNYPSSKHRYVAGYRRAKIFVDTERWEAAIYWFDRLLKEKPPADVTAASLYFRSDACLKNDQEKSAVQGFEQIRKKHQTSEFYSLALLRLGEIYSSGFRFQVSGFSGDAEEKALKVFKEAEKSAATKRIKAEALFQIAEVYFRRKDFKKSAEAYKQLLVNHPADVRSMESKLRAAWSAHNAGLYADALQYMPPEVGQGEQEEEWLYLKANCERQLKNNKDAISTYSELLKEYPESEFFNAAIYEKALVFYKIGKFDDAVKEAEKVKLTDRIRKDVFWLFAESYAGLKENEKAVQYYRLIIDEFPDSGLSCDAAYRLAHRLQAKGEYREASRFYNFIVTKFSDNKLAPQSLFASAYCQQKAGMDAEAVRDWTTLIREYPKHKLVEESIYQKAIGETRLRRDKDAIVSFRELLKKYPRTQYAANSYYWLGILLKEAGKKKDAVESFQHGLKSGVAGEMKRETKYQLALVLRELGKKNEASDLFFSLLSTDVQDKFSPSLLQWLTEYKLGEKEYNNALSAAEVLVKNNSESTWQEIGWFLMGRTYFAKKDLKNAKKAFKKALDANAGTRFAGESALRLGQIMLSDGSSDEAFEYFMRASRLASDDSMLDIRAHAYAGLGAAAESKSDLETAAKYFMSVAILFDDAEIVPECLYKASNVLKKAGRKEDARKALEELRERYPKSKWVRGE